MLVNALLEESFALCPDKVALVCGKRRLTYGEIEASANRLANALLRRGLQQGDRVAIWLPNSVEAVIGIFAALKAGAIFTVLNPTTKVEKLTRILNNSRAAALLAPAAQTPMLGQMLPAVPSLHTVVCCGDYDRAPTADERLLPWAEAMSLGSDERPPCSCIDIDLATIIYTSGSTGVPKGVMCTHLNVLSATRAINSYVGNTPADVVINVLPLSFDYGLYQIFLTFMAHGRLVLEPSFAYPAMVLHRIQEERVTGFPGVPTVFAMLLQMDLTAYDLSSLRYMTNTGAALPVEHIRAIRERFPHVRFYSMYGLTECKRVSYLPPEELDRRPGSVGKAIPNCEVRIVDENGRPVAPGHVGELIIRGSNVMQGYWEMPEETARVYKPGRYPGEVWLYSGDLFRMDEEGFLYFVARRDNMIKSRGNKVSPREIEDVLYRLPDVIEAAVRGEPDPVLGQAIVAYVALKPESTLTERDVLRHCAHHLEDALVPQQVQILTSLPKTPSGKITVSELR